MNRQIIEETDENILRDTRFRPKIQIDPLQVHFPPQKTTNHSFNNRFTEHHDEERQRPEIPLHTPRQEEIEPHIEDHLLQETHFRQLEPTIVPIITSPNHLLLKTREQIQANVEEIIREPQPIVTPGILMLKPLHFPKPTRLEIKSIPQEKIKEPHPETEVIDEPTHPDILSIPSKEDTRIVGNKEVVYKSLKGRKNNKRKHWRR